MSDSGGRKPIILVDLTPLPMRTLTQTPENLEGPPTLGPRSSGLQISSRQGCRGVNGHVNLKVAGRDAGSSTVPDRFIPVRRFKDCPTTPFRVGKDYQELSPEEKILRRRSPKEDPFVRMKDRRFPNTARRTSRVCSTHYGPHLVNDSAVTRGTRSRLTRDPFRQVSLGAIWAVGGASAAIGRRSTAILEGPPSLLASGTTAPRFSAKFLPQAQSSEDDREQYKSRIALALDIDPATRILGNCNLQPLLTPLPSPASPDYELHSPLIWKDNAWRRAERNQRKKAPLKESNIRLVPSLPFRTLDAPLLRDDFYCSALAYSSICGTLAVGLGHRVYLWSEAFGVQHPPLGDHSPSNYVTSLSFSSEDGERSILAIGRKSGMLSLWSAFDSKVRFEVNHSETVTCVAFKQTKSLRMSGRYPSLEVDTEDLAVGDDLGNIWYYSVEWPDDEAQYRFGCQGTVTLLAKISAHSQQICGIAWSPDSVYLATGGNDNACLLFKLHDIIPSSGQSVSTKTYVPYQNNQPRNEQEQDSFSVLAASAGRRLFNKRHLIGQLLPSWTPFRPKSPTPSRLSPSPASLLISTGSRMVLVPPNRQKHRLVHSAAVKAIAFAPWQPSLLATGGGSNDRAIHFYHTPSGACLATINVYAQVTSLIWSKTRREIVATLGFAQPEHPFRIAVFAWPSCEQISAIPWGPHGSSWDSPANDTLVDCGRALYAISYPGRPPTCPYLPNTSEESPSPPFSRHGLYPNGTRHHMLPNVGVQPKAKEGGLWCSRTVQEGCIIVASSDQSVKFHEIWSASRRHATTTSGPYGGSDILEGLEGLENPGSEIIR